MKVDAQVTTAVNTETDSSTLLLSDSSSTGQGVGNNHSETGDVTVDAQVESQVNNKTDISTLVMSDSSFLAKSEETGQDIRNNRSEKAAVKVDAHVEPTVNSQTDSSTLVTSDTSLLEKSHDETGKMAEKINPFVTTPQKVNEEVETDSTLVTSDTCSSFLAKSDNETGNASVKQPEIINLLVTTPQKVNEQVEMQNTETDSTLVTSSSLFLAESEDQTHDDLGKQVKEINSLKTAAKVDEPVEMQKNTEPDSTLATIAVHNLESRWKKLTQ